MRLGSEAFKAPASLPKILSQAKQFRIVEQKQQRKLDRIK